MGTGGMCELTGEYVDKLETLGVRVRLVEGLGEGALYFRKRALALVDSRLTARSRDQALGWVLEQMASRRESAESARPHLTPLP